MRGESDGASDERSDEAYAEMVSHASVQGQVCMLILIFLRKPLPLTTVELQKSGSRLLRLAPKRVLDVSLPLSPYMITHTHTPVLSESR